ncbi:DUF3800 domain-containing protein [Knoellia sp. CPCC 206453]|uniref:DUF3800 domain-containing protein n=1 Tax=Knoellia pratensis TaxID=3404796 RepID=UPI00361F4D5D
MTRVYAYVDETGDRGAAPSSSPVFGMAAILVPEDRASAIQAAVQILRADLCVPNDKTLSWKDYAKTHDRRRRAADVLGAVEGIKVCYVFAQKAALQPGSYVGDKERFYNYLAFMTYKSIVWASRNMGATEVIIRFGHVKHHDHEGTKTYIEREASSDARVPDHLVKSIQWVPADRYRESEAADLFGGFLKSAVWPSGQFGYVEPKYLLSVWHKIRNSESCAIPLGIMSMPQNSVLTSEAWFPCAQCKK